MGKRPIKEILKEQGKIAVKELAAKGINKLKRMNDQTGGRKKHIKRRRMSKLNHSKQIGKGRRRKGKSNKKKAKKATKRRKTRVVDIFNN